MSIGVLCVRLCLSFVCNGARKRHAIVEDRRGGAKVRREGGLVTECLCVWKGLNSPSILIASRQKSGVHNVVHQ